MAKIDDSVKKKVPELRFPGFTDDWEERKFADFIDVKSGKDYKHLNSGSIPVYGTGGYMLSVDRALSDIDAIGIGRKGTIDKPYLLKAPFWTVDTLFYAVPKQNIDLQFSLSIFKKINWKKFDESTGVPSLSKTVINSVGASVPSYEEQQKIGSFFQQLDETIALHQRKLAKLKELKQGYLQKLFPKNGSKFPQLRFAGFADAWEQRKLGELGKIYTGNTPKTSDLDNWTDNKEGHIWITPTDIDKLIMSDSDRHLSEQGWSKARKIPENSVLITSIASIGKNTINAVPVAFNQQINAIVPEKNDSYFILSAMIKDTARFASVAGQTATAIINKTTFEKFQIATPSYEEQQKIGSFFKQLDNTITLHQRKLDLLKEQKKGFLQNMFV